MLILQYQLDNNNGRGRALCCLMKTLSKSHYFPTQLEFIWVSSHKKINPIATILLPELSKILCQKLLFS